MMTRYQFFIVCFIISIVAGMVSVGIYVSRIASFISMAQQGDFEGNPALAFRMIFSPQLIIPVVVGGIASLAYRILGIVFIAGNPKLEGGEKAIWIIGFILFGFIAAIVFMALASSRNLTGKREPEPFKL